MSDETSKGTDDTVPADPEEPMYEQLGEDGNPFSAEQTENPALSSDEVRSDDQVALDEQAQSADSLEPGRETEQPGINPQTDDEVDRAAHHY